MTVLAVIPARGGSKAIPDKNIVPLAGKPLIWHTCNAVRNCRRVNRAILSTDSQRIADVVRAWGVDVPFLRPPELAADETPMFAVLDHALNWLERVEGFRPDIVVLLQPTSPLRRAEHIDGAIERLLESEADTVVSVVQVPHQFGPSSLMTLDDRGCLRPLSGQPPVLRRQDKPMVFARNGPAVLVMRRQVLAEGRIYGSLIKPYEMSMRDSVDIDGSEDLELAEYLLQKK